MISEPLLPQRCERRTGSGCNPSAKATEAHNLVTSHDLSGAVRFPVDYELYRRYEEVTQWESFVARHFPGQALPATAKARQKRHKQLDKELLKDPEFARLGMRIN